MAAKTPSSSPSSGMSTSILAKLTTLDGGQTSVASLGGCAGIASAVGSSLTKGLAADRVAANRASFGANVLPQKQRKPFLVHLVEALGDDTLKILVFSAACSMGFGIFLSPNSADVIQGIAIILAVIIVSGINSFQNWSKDREFHSLAAYTTKDSVNVLRNGESVPSTSTDLVVGDIVLLREGSKIPADGILISGHNVSVNNSSLNGESRPAAKSKDDIMHHSALIVGGSDIRVLVTAVGENSAFGELAKAVTQAEHKDTPLQEKLSELADQIGKGGTAFGVLTFIVLLGLWCLKNYVPGVDMVSFLKEAAAASTRFFIVGVTIVVVAVPEGLPLAVTISLAFSMQRMLADKNLVRELSACETMGSATVVASDKTGTLTENRMTVVKVYLPGGVGGDATPHAMDLTAPNSKLVDAVGGSDGALQRLAVAIAVNSEAELRYLDQEEAAEASALGAADAPRVVFDGSPTECALLQMLEKAGVSYRDLRSENKVLARRAFDKANKFQTSIAKTQGGITSFVTGAPEIVLGMCKNVHRGDGTNKLIGSQIDDEARSQHNAELRALASQGLRVIAVAFKRLSLDHEDASGSSKGKTNGSSSNKASKGGKQGDDSSDESKWQTDLSSAPGTAVAEVDLNLWGLFAIQDPPRPGVADAVRKIKAAGVRVMMVTGDAMDTAEEIARQCAILPLRRLGSGSSSSSSSSTSGGDVDVTEQRVMTGETFRELSEDDRRESAKSLCVLARCSPTDKLLLVRALRANGEVVAVTGDGTNDAPALTEADVGLAMGIAGTEVAIEASKIVITDDNFASIVATVRWGRSIKQNIRKFLTFQLTINGVALLLTFITACTSNGSTDAFPIKPVQLLWINLIMDSFAALMLATEPPSERLMQYKPQGREEALITPRMWKNIFGHVVYQTILLLWLTMTESGSNFFGLDYIRADDRADVLLQRKEDTIVFTTFVCLQIFNLFNCRAVHDEWNILEGFGGSVITQVVLAIIVISQFVIVQIGGDIMQTGPLTWDEWKACISLGATSIAVGYLLKLIPVCGGELKHMSASETEEMAEEVAENTMGTVAAAKAKGAGGATTPGRETARQRAVKAAAKAAEEAAAPKSAKSASKGGKAK